jgi:hypothetical protein
VGWCLGHCGEQRLFTVRVHATHLVPELRDYRMHNTLRYSGDNGSRFLRIAEEYRQAFHCGAPLAGHEQDVNHPAAVEVTSTGISIARCTSAVAS